MLNKLPTVQLISAAFLFGAGNTVQKSLFTDIEIWSELGLRALIAVVVLMPAALFELGKLSGKSGANPKVFIAPSAAFFVGMCLQQIGSFYTTATNVGFLVNSSILIVPIMVWFMRHKAPDLIVWPATILCFIGMLLLSGSTPKSLFFGDIFCILAAIAFAVWVVTLGKAAEAIDAPTLSACFQWLPLAIFGLTIGAFRGPHDVYQIATRWPELLFVGVFASAFAVVLASNAQRYLSSCTCGICYALEGVFGAVIAFLWLGENLTPQGFAGAALICASVVLIQSGSKENIVYHMKRSARAMRTQWQIATT